ncbi:MAG: tetratricopeptide repeat protein [Saccharofermentanales bacterium]|jgi:TPR repeat protein
MELTQADRLAIQKGDHDFILNKGAKFYVEQDYTRAIEYYHLAASMGNMQAVSNLGYCYMYAHGVERNMDLALAYFHISAQADVIDSLYKLGNIYERGKDVETDEELAIYYYSKALGVIMGNHLIPYHYPSLFLALGRAHMPDGLLVSDLETAYEFLQYAKRGYEIACAEGVQYWEEALAHVKSLLEDPVFDPIRDDPEDDDDWDLDWDLFAQEDMD